MTKETAPGIDPRWSTGRMLDEVIVYTMGRRQPYSVWRKGYCIGFDRTFNEAIRRWQIDRLDEVRAREREALG